MKKNYRNSVLLALSIVITSNSLPVLAGGNVKQSSVSQNTPRVSDRLIVKFRPNYLPKGLSVSQINAELAKPFAAQTLSQMAAAAGVQMTEVHALSNGAHVLALPNAPTRMAMDQVIAGISALANVEYVEEDRILTAQAVPNDTYYITGPGGNPGLWGMQPVTSIASPAPGNTGSYGADFESAWNTNTGTGIVVAVVDTGITPHPDIVGAAGTVSPATGNLVSPGYDFTSDCRMRNTCAATTLTAVAGVAPSPNATDLGDFISVADSTTVGSFFFGSTVSNSTWHGTHVSGTIAAIGNNNVGVIGGAYNAKILPVRVLGKGGGYMSDIANGIRWAAGVHPTIANPNPAKVINMSLGGSGACGITEQNAINAAVAAGTVVVVAAGNSNADVANFTPASCANVVTVASVGRDGSRAAYSNFSSPASNPTPVYVTLAAQGGDQSRPAAFEPGILSTLNAGLTTAGAANYVYYNGTSMATPHAAAAAALMMARNPALTPAQVKTVLSAPASLTTFPGFTGSGIVAVAFDCAASANCGAGILNAKLAVQNSIVPLTASLSAVDFGSLTLNSTVNQTETFTNSSLLPVTNGVTTITGANAALFTIVTDTCNNATIAVGGTCQVAMSYAPVASGSHSATLSIPTSVAGVATAVGLTGVGGSALTTPTPAPTATTVNVGQSTTVNLSFANPNATTVKVSAVTLSNPAIMATSVDNCSNATLTAGASCAVTVTVTPATAGAYSGTVTVSMSGGGTPTRATISGTATTPPAASGGGGGCSVMPAGTDPDTSLPLAALIMLAYWASRRSIRNRGAD
ncbi:MAG: S8 family serine peptidase [Gallionella sp.]|jgi:serine protease